MGIGGGAFLKGNQGRETSFSKLLSDRKGKKPLCEKKKNCTEGLQ